MLQAKELRGQSLEELEATLEEIKLELFTIRSEGKQSKKFEQPHLLREKKRDIARLLTVIHEKQRQR